MLEQLTEKLHMNRRAQGMEVLKTGIIGIVIVGIVGAIGGLILQKFGEMMGAGTAGSQIVGNASTTIVNMMAWLPIVGITVVGAVVLGMVLIYIGNR